MSRPRRPGARKSIFDPVHGAVTVEGAGLELLGCRAFQRLWEIRQTGFAHLVFPGANHTRLEHSLGTYWVARRMSERLSLSGEVAARVAMGALLHDLGHGPFSHTLDGPMHEVLGHGHESISREWIVSEGPTASRWRAAGGRSIPEILEFHGISPKATADLVDPPDGSPASTAGAILHGAIDADRLDYLQRDAHYTGVAHGAIDAARLLDTLGTARERLVFAEKGRDAVEGFLVGRSLMYSSVYYHKTVRAGEVMAQAAVERMTGFPDASVPLLYGTDGELLYILRRSGPVSGRLVEALEGRRLHKRAFAFRRLTPEQTLRFRRLSQRPTERREFEDELAVRLDVEPGGVLLDLAGLRPRSSRGHDWQDVGIREGRRVVYPFRSPSLWSRFALRPPSAWPVAVYVEARAREHSRRRLGPTLRRML